MMTLADQIIADSQQYAPTIERHADGDITIRWPRPRALMQVVNATGLDEELFSRDWRSILLHIPKDVAESSAA